MADWQHNVHCAKFQEKIYLDVGLSLYKFYNTISVKLFETGKSYGKRYTNVIWWAMPTQKEYIFVLAGAVTILQYNDITYSTAVTEAQYNSAFEQAGKLWGVSFENLREMGLCYNATAQYIEDLIATN